MAELRLFWEYMGEQADRIRRVVGALDSLGLSYALMGGHAISHHLRPRVTVDVDFVVSARSFGPLIEALSDAGFVAEQRGEILRAWEREMDTSRDEPVVDIIPAHSNRTQLEALRTAEAVVYQDMELRVVTRPALAAQKFLAANSAHRAQEDRLQDAADLARLVKSGWTEADQSEAERLIALSQPGADAELAKFVDDVQRGRPLTI